MSNSEEQIKPTQALILDAAMKVFTAKGFAAARTTEIAEEAGINRALLHYYYKDKQTIFNLIFETRFSEFFGGLNQIINSEVPFLEKIRLMVYHEIETFSKHPDLARFIVIEVARQPEILKGEKIPLAFNPKELMLKFEEEINQETMKGTIINIEPRQLVMNLMSLCTYPFVSMPILKTVNSITDEQFYRMMDARKKQVYEFIVKAIKK